MAVITYKCPNCGGDLRFHPESQKYRCEYCQSEFTPEEAEAKQEILSAEDTVEKKEAATDADTSDASVEGASGASAAGDAKAAGASDDAVLYHCPSCGAEIITDENTVATFCYYCHNPVVLEGRMKGEFHPDYVLPFAIDRDKVLTIFRQWIGQKRYVPKAFYNEEQIEKLTGVYFPYWLYDCKIEAILKGVGLKNRVWNSGNMQYTETSKYNVDRDGQMPVQNVIRNALSKANRQLVEGVLPFEMDKLKPFQMGYLSGFMAEKRDIEEDVFEPEVKQEVQTYAQQELSNEIALYDSMQVEEKKIEIKDEKWNYALMPVWTLTYKDPKDNKIYYFACNGQTGKICGELPVDKPKLMGLFAAIFVPLFVVLMIVGYFL